MNVANGRRLGKVQQVYVYTKSFLIIFLLWAITLVTFKCDILVMMGQEVVPRKHDI